MDKERIVTAMSTKEDEDQSLRPQSLDQYIGQDDIKEMLDVYIKAAVKRKEEIGRAHV